MYVDETRCTSCGVCLQVCPSNALRLVDDKVRIDAALCNDCQACVEVCPSDAIITTLPAIVPAARATTHSTQINSVVKQKTLAAPARVIAPAIGTALTFLGREVAPRVASAVAETMLNHAAERTRTMPTSSVRKDSPRRLRRRVRGIGR